jgi:uncharacterized membrane protein
MDGMAIALQVPEVWHRQGLFMGMHWAWWLFWIITLAIIAWAFLRLYLDRRYAQRRELERRRTEAVLRERFHRGEIDERELLERLMALQDASVASA